MKASRQSETEEVQTSTSPKRVGMPTDMGSAGEAGETTREIRLANVRAKVKALSSGRSFRFDAITDLIAEARLNKASLLDTRRAALELVKLLGIPNGQRRATTYRDLCELGRNLHLPSWHGSERRHLYVWYHCLHRIRLMELDAGDVVMKQGELGDTTFWLLNGMLEEFRTGPPMPSSPTKSPVRMSLLRARSETLERLKSLGDGRGVPTVPGSPRASGDGDGTQEPSVPAAALTTTTASTAISASVTSASATSGQSPSRRSAVTPATGPSGSGEGLSPLPSMSLDDESPSLRSAARKIQVFERFGQEALQGNAYTMTVEATTPCQLAALSKADYQAVVALAAKESFEGLRAMSSLLSNKSNRPPKAIADLSSLLSVTEMFRSMDQEFRSELCGLLEFLALPEGTILFEEGDKIDFTYVILKGEVVLSRYNEVRNASEDFAVKTTGQQFGTMSALQVSAAAAAAAAAAGAGSGAASVVAAAAGGSGGAAVDKKRNFSARCTQLTEFAIVTKVGYTRLIRNQLQKSLNTRLELLQGMAIMSNTTTQSVLTRIAINCQDESFSAGSVIVDPAYPPTRLFFIVEGQAKLMWVAESLGQLPPATDRPLDTLGSGFGGSGGGVSISGSVATGAAVSVDGGAISVLTRDGRSIKRRQQPYVYELALLTRGDVVNGLVLHGRTSCFTVVAATNTKVMSLEVAGGLVALEQLFGREQAAMLRELVLLQAEVHRERAAHMVAIRQNSVHLKDHRPSTTRVPSIASESATFLQHYIPKTPGVDAFPPSHLIGYAAAVADTSLFVPGAVQHGDVMKLVTAAGQSVLDNLPSPQPVSVTATPPLRRGLTSSGSSMLSSAAGGGGSVSGGRSFSSSPISSRPPSKHPSSEMQLQRDQQRDQHQHQQLLTPQQHQQQHGGQQLQGQQQPQSSQTHHVTTVVAQPVALPRTRMRVPSPGMARELGLEAPPPEPTQQFSSSALDRVSSLGLLPDPAGGKSRNGHPRAPQRTLLGLPFAGNVAMLMLENHSDLVKVVSSYPSTLDCIATLRQATKVSPDVSFCDDDGQCEDGWHESSTPDTTYNRLPDGVGHSVMVFTAQPMVPSARSAPSSPPLSYIPSAPHTPRLDCKFAKPDGDAKPDPPWCTAAAGDGTSVSDVGPEMTSTIDGGSAAASGSESSSSVLVAAACGVAARDGGGSDDINHKGDERLSPFSSMHQMHLLAGEDCSNGNGNCGGGGGGGGGAGGFCDIDISSILNGIEGEPSWSARQSPYMWGPPSPLSHVEPLTLAASQSVLQMQSSVSSMGGGATAGGTGLRAASPLGPPLSPMMPSARSTAALLGSGAIPLAAGQVHVPLTSVYRRMAPAPGAAGTIGAVPTPVLAATAVVQPAVSAETAKLCSSRLTTIMSTGPLAETAQAMAGSLGSATEAAAAAAYSATPRCVGYARLSSPSSLPPSTSSSYTRDCGNQGSASPSLCYGPLETPSPSRLLPPPLSASPDSVVILPRMLVYETALLDATVGAGGVGGASPGGANSAPSSPRGGACAGGNGSSATGSASSSSSSAVRLASLGPTAASAAAAAAAAAAASATVPLGEVGAALKGHAVHVLPALPGSAVAAAAAAAAPATVTVTAGSSAPGTATPVDSPRLRPPPRMLRSMDAVPMQCQYGTSRELLGYISSNPRLTTEHDDAGMVFTGGLGGRPVGRYGSPGAPRRQGGGSGGATSSAGASLRPAAVRRIGGVSLRELAGVNGLYRDSSRSPIWRSALSQKGQDGPDLPLELDTEAPSLQNRKLSEPSLDDLKYILTRWSNRWSQERRGMGGRAAGVAGLQLCPSISEPGSPLRLAASADLMRYGYTSDDLYRMAREQQQQQQQQQLESIGSGPFKRPLTQLDLFGLPYIGGTPRVEHPDSSAATAVTLTTAVAAVTRSAAGAASTGGGVGGSRVQLGHRNDRSGSSNR